MAAIDESQLVSKMLGAAQGVLADKWPEARDYAETEFKKLAETIAFIEAQRALGQMSDEKACLHLNMQENSAKTILLTLEGLGILAVEAAINAALDVVKEAVNSTLGFALI